MVLTGVWPALSRLVAKIPPQISAAMLAGVIFPFVAATVQSGVDFPLLIMPVIVIWLLLNRLLPLWASPIAIVIGFALIAMSQEAKELRGLVFLAKPGIDFSGI